MFVGKPSMEDLDFKLTLLPMDDKEHRVKKKWLQDPADIVELLKTWSSL